MQDLLDAGQLRITARLDPTEPVIATQRARLIIEIATPNWFTGGTRLGDLPVRNAIVLQRQTFGNNSNRRINGETWAVQGWEFEIFPRYPGTYKIPGVEVSVEVASGSGGSIRGETITNPVTLEAIEPPVAPPAEAWVVSPELSVRATWDQPLEGLQAGDARQRTLTITAEELPSMVLPAPTYAEIGGVAVYPQPARRDDQTNRGQSTATFTQTVSYFCERAGSFTIPDFALAWWDPGAEQWRIASVPAETFEVAANPNAPAEAATPEPSATPRRALLKRFSLISVSLFIVALIGRSLRQWSSRWWARRRERLKSATAIERERWRELRAQLRSAQSTAIVTALYRWRDSLPPTGTPATLNQLALGSRDSRLVELLDALLSSRYGNQATAFRQAHELTEALIPVRRRALRQSGRAYVRKNKFNAKRLN